MLGIYFTERFTKFQERVIIEGEDRSGARFSMLLMLTYNPHTKTAEQALIESFESRASNFEELAVEQGWYNTYWTYPMGVVV